MEGPTLLLTTTGRRSRESRTTPLIYGQDDGSFVVVGPKAVPTTPAWYLNLTENPDVEVR